MARNVKISEYSGRFENPAVQLSTTMTQVMNEGIDLPVSGDLQFTSDLVSDYAPLGNCTPFQIFKSDDPLTYRKFDPKKIKQMREANKQGEQSGQNAENLNPSIS